MEKIGAKKQEEVVLEDFTKTVKSADMDNLLRLKDEFAEYRSENRGDYFERSSLLNQWKRLMQELEPQYLKTRLYHFLIGSNEPEGYCEFDDFAGDHSAEKFLRADIEGKKELIKKLEDECRKKGKNAKS
jgi:hypothetical protein